MIRGCQASLRDNPEDAQVQLPPTPPQQDPQSLAHIPGLPFPIWQLPGTWEAPQQRSLGNGGSWEWQGVWEKHQTPHPATSLPGEPHPQGF